MAVLVWRGNDVALIRSCAGYRFGKAEIIKRTQAAIFLSLYKPPLPNGVQALRQVAMMQTLRVARVVNRKACGNRAENLASERDFVHAAQCH
jgi:hypothetical protein